MFGCRFTEDTKLTLIVGLEPFGLERGVQT